MKKIIALVIAILMMAAIAVPAFAVDQTVSSNNGTAGTEVSYTVEGAYSVTIPDSATFAKESEESSNMVASIAISASGILEIGQVLTVTVDSENTTDSTAEDETAKDTWNLKNGTELVAYTINDGAILPGATVLTYEAGDAATSVTLALKIVTPATKAATYTDTLTFTVAVGAAA